RCLRFRWFRSCSHRPEVPLRAPNGKRSLITTSCNFRSLTRRRVFFLRLEELLHLVEEALTLRRHVLAVQFGQLPQKLLLLLGERLGRFHHHLDFHVAAAAGPQAWLALAVKRDELAALQSCRQGVIDRSL